MKPITITAVALFAAICTAPAAQAQVQPAVFGAEQPRSKSVFYLPYARFGVGAESAQFDDAYWESPGQDDPRVFFDLPDETGAMGYAALGVDWGKGVRAEIAVLGFGEKDVAGPWSYTDPASEGPHASMSGTVSSGALMANVFVSPLEVQGNTGRFQPFVMAGIGAARNDMGDWTRTNPDKIGREERSFEGDTKTDFAWAIGLGAAWQIGERGQKPVMLELMYQHIDLGRAQGGSVPLPGSETSEPREPFGFDVKTDVVSVGVRIPIR